MTKSNVLLQVKDLVDALFEEVNLTPNQGMKMLDFYEILVRTDGFLDELNKNIANLLLPPSVEVESKKSSDKSSICERASSYVWSNIQKVVFIAFYVSLNIGLVIYQANNFSVWKDRNDNFAIGTIHILHHHFKKGVCRVGKDILHFPPHFPLPQKS